MIVSVIIPTYNRRRSLERTLASIAKQTQVSFELEVIVVDDGSTDDTHQVAENGYPFNLVYIKQKNSGDAQARNYGAKISQGDPLIFIDDDMLFHTQYLKRMVAAYRQQNQAIIVGTEIGDGAERLSGNPDVNGSQDEILVEQPFVEVYSRNMCVGRCAFQEIGPMVDLGFAGSSIWCDVEFAYRAYQRHYRFYRSRTALCFHDDYLADDNVVSQKRYREAARRAVPLFQMHPELEAHIPMLTDMVPVRWTNDRPTIILRKLLRRLSSSEISVTVLDWLRRECALYAPNTRAYRRISIWLQGAYIYRGYQEGLRELGANN